MSVDLHKYPSLKPYVQHGVNLIDIQNTQARADCPFCNSRMHFFVNYDNQLWDCKKCSKSGNVNTFFKFIAEQCCRELRGNNLLTISRDRGLNISTLRHWKLGYNKATKNYTIPISDSRKTIDVRLYDTTKLISSSFGHAWLFGFENLLNSKSMDVWICEGEWDGMAGYEIVKFNGKDIIVVAVPGAGTFKKEWITFFRDKKVLLLYDNDEAGILGETKAYLMLKDIVKELKFVDWTNKRSDKFDLRDFYVKENEKDAKKTFLKLQQLITSTPRNHDVQPQTMTEVKRTTVVTRKNRISTEDIRKVYKKWLYLFDEDVIDVLFGTIIANRMSGDPIWLYFITPPGGSKTELLMPFSDCNEIITTTSLTPHALVSGANFGGFNNDPSLIPKLNGKVLIIKDFTTMLNMPQINRDEIFGILRDAYDGRTEKFFGTGVHRIYKSKFGIIAGVTPAIDTLSETQSTLGERFLKFRLHPNRTLENSQKMIKKAMENTSKEEQLRSELSEVANKALSFDYTKSLPIISDDIKDKILRLSQWTAILRGSVVREKYSGDINYKPSPEVGTRLAKQLTKLMLGITMFRFKTKVSMDEYKIVARVAADTVTERTENTVSVLFSDATKLWEAGEIGEKINLPHGTVSRVLQDLAMLRVVQKSNDKNLKNKYFLKPEIISLVKDLNIY